MNDVSKLGWPGVIAIVALGLCQLVKSDKIPINVAPRWRSWLAIAIAMVTGTAAGILAGKPIGEALGNALLGGVGSVGVYEATTRPFAPATPSDPSAPLGSGGGVTTGEGASVMKRAKLALLAFGFVMLGGCVRPIDVAVTTVNVEEDALTDAERELEGLESHDLTVAIDAAKTLDEANASKLVISTKYKPFWTAYDKARAQWVIARLAVATYQQADAAGTQPDATTALNAVATLAQNFATLESAVKELVK